MKAFTEVALVAALVAGASAQPHQHQHRHHHAKKHDHSPVELAQRDVTWVQSIETVYIDESGKAVDPTQAAIGIAEGMFIIVGESTPTFTTPAAPASTSTEAAEFYEQKTSTTTSSATSSASPAAAAPSNSGGAGLTSNFPSGQVQCGAGVPTSYGPISLSQLGTEGWASLQQPSNGFTPGVAVETIVAPVSGGCTPGTFCSYGCPPGYEKSQWPASSQGARGQSVGGLWCNSNGFLELTNPSVQQLCTPGAGGVFVQNTLSGGSCICRTDYPGSESMVIPVCTEPGQTYPLTNPNSVNYYEWEGKPTTAQYYINNLNVGLNDACVWNSPNFPSSAGNWAPMNLGVGQDSTGTTYISLFPNAPTSSATLNFNVKITGDINGACSWENGAFSGGGNGCTVGMASGGTATIVLY